uniref:Uncharacterized protein n=1 Tax=Myotis myotis TaxID=51298 RepID=A0A7J7Z590_MYOMY|nr:hypothetical protein mMyoMyo1_010626 [Myotis myotis]
MIGPDTRTQPVPILDRPSPCEHSLHPPFPKHMGRGHRAAQLGSEGWPGPNQTSLCYLLIPLGKGPQAFSLSADPAATRTKHTLIAASLEASASGQGETTRKHGFFSSVSIRVRWEGQLQNVAAWLPGFQAHLGSIVRM